MAEPSHRAGYGPTLVLGLLGAVAVTVGVSRPWVGATANVAGLPTLYADASGADLVPLAGALGVVLLAAFGAVVATRNWVRRCLGLLIVVASVVVAVAAIHPANAANTLTDGLAAKGWSGADYSTTTMAWRWLVLVGALVCLGAGAAVARFGAGWATMGSRYDAPAAPVETRSRADGQLTEAEVWHAIDQGHDPTQRP